MNIFKNEFFLKVCFFKMFVFERIVFKKIVLQNDSFYKVRHFINITFVNDVTLLTIVSDNPSLRIINEERRRRNRPEGHR